MNKVAYLVLQPTPFCNIDCSYCFLPARSLKAQMSPDTLELVFRDVLCNHCDSEITIVWHAGEPLTLPISYYEAAILQVERMRPSTVNVHHSFNTNGMLITKQWCNFFRKFDVNLGLSLDGPQTIHDERRVTRAGGGTYAKVIGAVRLLQEQMIPFYVISVLGRSALLQSEAMFAFYRDEGIQSVCFNVEEVEGVNTTSTLGVPIYEEQHVAFLRTFWRLLAEGGHPFRVREFDDALRDLTWPGDSLPCHSQIEPFIHLSVDHLGNVYTFSPELMGASHPRYANFAIGNVHRETIATMATGPALRSLQQEIAAGVDACRAKCAYFGVCGGGAPVNKLFENGDFNSTETMYCRMSKKAVINVALDFIEAAASQENLSRSE